MAINTDFMIVVGGVCGSGKSTLVSGLKERGYHVHSVAQEHSYAPKMYMMTKPDYVILLECEYETVCKRRQVGWTREHLASQIHRLRHMREYCHLLIKTDDLTIEEVLNLASNSIDEHIKQYVEQEDKSYGDLGASKEK